MTPQLNTWTAIEGLLQNESDYALDMNFSRLSRNSRDALNSPCYIRYAG